MATWQQGLNSGGLLAGIGQNNSNAPQASDINGTLSLIRANQEANRSGQNNVGLQALQGIQSVQQQYKQAQQQQKTQEFQQAFGQAYAKGDREALKQLAANNPEQIEAIQKGMGFIDEDKNQQIGSASMDLQLAAQTGNPQVVASVIQKNAGVLYGLGLDPETTFQAYQQDPQSFSRTAELLGMHALGPEKYFDFKDKAAGRDIDRGKLSETIRSNQAGEGLQARQIAQSRENSIRASSGQNSQPASVKEYQYFQSLSPEQQKTYMRVRGRPDAGGGSNTVQLADGRTVTVAGKLHGAGASAFYEGTDNDGNMVRVPASAIAAPPTSAASAQNFGMSKDLDAIESASPDNLGFMTGVTGSSGSPAIGADVRSRISGKDQRQLYNSAQRIQGKMQNQGIAAARDMGASGINTVAEAKMYFQGMPQIDFSSPESMQQSVKDIRQYTDTYNQQYQVNVGDQQRSQQPPQQPAGSSYTSKSGIQFTVK